MEKAVNPSEQKTLIIELTQGQEMANELKKQLDSFTSSDTCEALVQNILSTYDKALSMLTWRAEKGHETLSPQSDSLADNSIISEGSNGLFIKDQLQCQKDVTKKRKTLPKWTEQVRVCYGNGHEGSLDDGYSWRKYGQKDILGANYPRAYYRCTHRNSRGCLATKQVQKSDMDPSMVEITYKGRHSCCNQAANPPSKIISDGKEMPKPKKARLILLEEGEEENKQRTAQEMMQQHLGQGLKVETEILKTDEEIFPSFSLSYTGVDQSENLESQFLSDVMRESADAMGGYCYSPAFLSPASSESNNYFSISSSCQMDNNFGYITDPQTLSKSNDFTDMISTPTSVITDSPFCCDLDFPIDQVDFDPCFSLDDALAYFS
ncbi:hypothetical protein ACH5RR_000088 [Cinchona calisaya]|uniref:WRKY domain-containing protein n=1 Tax=Cinchona calisaya TaxID=153742 RepID=A0ABD3AZM2_9GENT